MLNSNTLSLIWSGTAYFVVNYTCTFLPSDSDRRARCRTWATHFWHGWRNGEEFTKFIFIRIHCFYCYSPIYLFTLNSRIYIQEIYLFTFTSVFLIANVNVNVYLYAAHITYCLNAVYNSNWVRSNVSLYSRLHLLTFTRCFHPHSKCYIHSHLRSKYSFSILCTPPLRIIRS